MVKTSKPQQLVTLTRFTDKSAQTKTEHTMTLEELAALITSTWAPSKAQLPLLKLARFGNLPTKKGCLRHNANLLGIWGVEGDYDGGKMPLEEAAERIAQARVAGLVYASPSHTLEAPHWRVLCPTSVELPPGDRNRLLARVNGVLGGILAPESWVLSQSYYFGRVSS